MKKSWIFLLVMTIVAGLFVGCAPKSDEGGQKVLSKTFKTCLL